MKSVLAAPQLCLATSGTCLFIHVLSPYFPLQIHDGEHEHHDEASDKLELLAPSCPLLGATDQTEFKLVVPGTMMLEIVQ